MRTTTTQTKAPGLVLGATLAALLTLLTGCTKGGGVNLSTESTTSTDESRKMDESKSKTMTASTSAKVTATVPAAQLIAQALRPLVGVAAIDMPAYARSVKFDGGPLFPGVVVPTEQAAAALKARLAQPLTDVVQMYAAPKLAACADLVLAKAGQPAAQDCFDDFYARGHAAAAVLAASWPQKTPGLKGEQVDLISKTRTFPAAALTKWVGGAAAVVDFSSALQLVLAKSIDRRSLSDPDAAQLEVVAALFAMPAATLKVLTPTPPPLSAVVSNGELSAPLEVFASELGEYIVQSEKGLVVSRNGAVWFGDGFISGKKIDVALESTSSASLERKRGLVLEQTDKSGTSTKAGVGLQ